MLGYQWTKGDRWTVETRGTHFWYVDAPIKGAPAHSFEGAIELSCSTSIQIKPTVEFAYDIRFRSLSVEASLAHVVVLNPPGTTLELRTYGGQVAATDVLPDTTGAATRDNYAYFGFGFRLRCEFSPHWVLNAEASLAGTVSQAQEWSPVGSAAGTRALIAGGTSYRF